MLTRAKIETLERLTIASVRPHGDECECERCRKANEASEDLVYHLDQALPELLVAARRDLDVRELDEWAALRAMRSWRCSNDGNDRRVTLYQRGMQEREQPAWFAAPTQAEARCKAAEALKQDAAPKES